MRLFRKTYTIVSVVFLISFIAAFLYKSKGLSDDLNTLLSIISFIFGFYVALAVSRAKERQDEVRRQLRLADGLFINCNIAMKNFDKEDQEKFLKKVDNYLVTSVDYRLVDIDKSSDEFFDILEFVVTELKPKNPEQNNAKDNIVDSLQDLSKERTLLEISAINRITKFEWLLILGLFSVIVYFIFNLNITGFIGDLFVAVSVSSLSMILIILSRFNNLSWREDIWIWKPLTYTFLQLGLKSYYGDFLVKQKRVRMPNDIEYRMAHYAHPYPDFSDKKVEIVKPKKII
jgi:hypothetical protein